MGDRHDLKLLDDIEEYKHSPLELPGHGLNRDSVSKYSSWHECVEAYAKDIGKKAKNERYILYGYSMGGRLMGSIAKELVKTDNPPRALILESSHLGNLNESERHARALNDRKLFNFAAKTEEDCADFLTKWWSAPLFGQMNQMENFPQLLKRKTDEAPTYIPYWQKALNLLSVAHQPNYQNYYLFQSGTPLLYLAGTQDQKYTQIGKSLEVKPTITVRYFNSGHNIHFTRPLALLKEISNFLSALQP